MTKSTADCKKLLVDTIKVNPSIVTSIYGVGRELDSYLGAGMGQAFLDALIASASDPKKWKRTHKCKPGSGLYEFDEYTIFDENKKIARMGYDKLKTLPASNFISERGFTLDFDQYDDGVAFVVIEDDHGQLYLGDYIGD